MTLSNKHLAVLAVLRQQNEAISLSELMVILGPNYFDRTVRRWLGDMVTEGLVEKLGQKRGTRYRAIQDQAESRATQFSDDANAVLAHVRQPIFKRDPVAYRSEWLDEYEPNISAYLPDRLARRLHQSGQKYQENELAGTYAHHIYNRLLIDLSYNSSRLEGNTYSLLETERLIFEGARAEGKLNEEVVMILNHKEAIRHLIDNVEKLQVNEDEIRTLHYLLSDGLVPTRYSGNIRDHGVRIGGSTYIPYENPARLKELLAIICQKAQAIKEPYEQSLFLLVHLSYLQAFTDVNKRTSRLSANIPLITNNLIPISFNGVGKDDYVSALLAIYELNEVLPLVELYADSYIRTCVLYDKTAESIGFDATRVRYRQERRTLISHIITQKLVGQAMQDYITTQTHELVKKEDQAAFLEDIQEDLAEISSQRIVGMGISVKQLNAWLKQK